MLPVVRSLHVIMDINSVPPVTLMLVHVFFVPLPPLVLLIVTLVLVLPLTPLTFVPLVLLPPTPYKVPLPSLVVLLIPIALKLFLPSVFYVSSDTMSMLQENVLPVLVPVLSHAPSPPPPEVDLVLVQDQPLLRLTADLSLLSLSPPSSLSWPLSSDLRSDINLF